MKKKYAVPVAVVVLLVFSLVSSIGCAGGKSQGAVDLMKKMPEDTTEFYYMDVKAFRGEENLEELFAMMRENFRYGDDNIDIFNADYVGGSDDLTIIRGNLGFDDIRNTLDEIGYARDEHGDVPVWGTGYSSIAIVGDIYVTGEESYVKASIGLIQGEGDSLRDTQYAKDIMNRLPNGIMMNYGKSDTMFKGLKAFGVSMELLDKDTLKVTGVFLFGSEDDARDAMDEIAEDIPPDSELQDVNRDGRFVIAAFDADIDYFI